MVKEQRVQDIRRCDRWYERSVPSIETDTRSDVSVPSDADSSQIPDIEASKKLLDLVNIITKTDKESFIGAFNDWYEKYKDVINKRVQDKRIKRKTPPYMRPRLRMRI